MNEPHSGARDGYASLVTAHHHLLSPDCSIHSYFFDPLLPTPPPAQSSLYRVFFFLEISLCVYQILKSGSFTCSFIDTCLSPEDIASSLHPQCGLLYFRAESEYSCCHSLVITPSPYNSWFLGHAALPPSYSTQASSSIENSIP